MDIFELGKIGTRRVRVILSNNEIYEGIIIRHTLKDFTCVESIVVMQDNYKNQTIDCSDIASITLLEYNQ